MSANAGCLGHADEEVWEYARAQGFTIVSKDSDFQQRSLLCGPPPKLVWLRIGNCTRQQIVRLITARQQEIQALNADPGGTILVLT